MGRVKEQHKEKEKDVIKKKRKVKKFLIKKGFENGPVKCKKIRQPCYAP